MADILTAEQVDALLDDDGFYGYGYVIDSHEALRARCEQAERERDANGRGMEILEGQLQRVERERDEARENVTLRETIRREQGMLLQERIAALEAHIREQQHEGKAHAATCGLVRCWVCGLYRESLALVPDETGAK